MYFTHSYLIFCIQTVKDAGWKTKRSDALRSQKWSVQAKVLLFITQESTRRALWIIILNLLTNQKQLFCFYSSDNQIKWMSNK